MSSTQKQPKLLIVLPCYNEEEVLPLVLPKLKAFMLDLKQQQVINDNSFLCFVDDGSADNTWNIIEDASVQNSELIKGIKFSKNYGHQSAILAGMMDNKGFDCVITIDVDLQDDISVIPKMIDDYNNGCEIVYGVRDNRDSDTFFKKWTAQLYYKTLKRLGVEAVYNHADYRLVGSKALAALSEFKETNLFLRGIFPILGFKTSMQYYARNERMAGETKYTLKKMMSLAWNGITSFSNKPLKIASFLGFITILISIGITIWAFIQHLRGNTVTGWASTVIPIYFLGGVQLVVLGIIGEYIGKTYMETKQRPKYLIDKKI